MCPVTPPRVSLDTQPHLSGHTEAPSHKEGRGRQRGKKEEEEGDRVGEAQSGWPGPRRSLTGPAVTRGCLERASASAGAGLTLA